MVTLASGRQGKVSYWIYAKDEKLYLKTFQAISPIEAYEITHEAERLAKLTAQQIIDEAEEEHERFSAGMGYY